MRLARRFPGLVFILACLGSPAAAQTDAAPSPSPEMAWYDFWPGTWVQMVDGRPDPNASSFIVRRGVHPASYDEEWRQVGEDGAVSHARAMRAWDQIGQRWMFVWVSDNALFQVWEGRKVGDRWSIVREFEIEGKRFLSRHAWWPEGPDRVVRINERSFDGGATWEIRFREEYARFPGHGGTAAKGDGPANLPMGDMIMSQTDQDRRVDYVEFPTRDIEKAKKFYQEAFGWKFTDYGPDYASFHDGRLSGGLRLEKEVPTGGPLVVIYAIDLPAIQTRVKEKGGRIVQEIFEFPGGRRFHFTDPSGNELAVWSDR